MTLPLSRQYSSITSDSRQVKQGGLFLAYAGANADGRNYIPQAIAAGAKGVFWDDEDFVWQDDWRVENIPIKNLKSRVSGFAAEFYKHPSAKMQMVGVTGTNGKTSVSQWVAQCLNQLGKKTAVVGTIGNGFLEAQTETVNTTPDACLLQKMLAQFLEQGAKAVVMEVSSHGLEQGRVSGVQFEVAILTNLSRDHLDYHQTMEAYAAAKQKLFTQNDLKAAVLNADDEFGRALASVLKVPVLTYGFSGGDIRGRYLQLNDNGIAMQVQTPQGQVNVSAPVLGRFNAYNVLAVLATLLALNVNLSDAVRCISNITPVRGRMQQFGGGEKPLVVVDYAHTPDALEKVLSTLREQTKGKLICVFGCGGNRDSGKRPLMGQVVEKLADSVVVTSDNPRNEPPASIIDAIIVGMKTSPLVEPDRAKAIAIAVKLAKKHDAVLVAGKGHEEYQEIAGVKHYFSDAEVVKATMEAIV